MRKLVFCPQINVQVFIKVILYHFRCVARHAQITQNNKFAISLQYFRKELSYKVDFLDADMHECFVQIDTMILMGAVKQSQISQNSFQRFYKISNKKIGIHFLHANKHQSLSKLASPFLEVARHIQSTQNRRFVIFLQYFKKKV